MLHGTTMEPKAKEAFWKYLNHLSTKNKHFYKQVSSGEWSDRSKIVYAEEKSEIISTPDCLFLYNEWMHAGLAVAEFKCPYKCVISRKDKALIQVVTEFLKENPRGKVNAFVQASTYSLVHSANMIMVVFYFTDTVEEEYIVVYSYTPTPSLFEEIFDAIIASNTALEELEMRKNSDRKFKPFRSPMGVQGKISELMTKCLRDTPLIYDVRNSETIYLDEECTDEGESSGPHIPGEIGS